MRLQEQGQSFAFEEREKEKLSLLEGDMAEALQAAGEDPGNVQLLQAARDNLLTNYRLLHPGRDSRKFELELTRNLGNARYGALLEQDPQALLRELGGMEGAAPALNLPPEVSRTASAAAARYGVPEGLVRAVIATESGGDAGEGLVKIRVKHPDVTRADVMSLPAIVREYTPHVDADGRRTWSVLRGDGHKLVTGETRIGENRVLATMFLETDGKNRPLSKKRTPAGSSETALQANFRDTGGGLSFQPDRSPQGRNRVATDAQRVRTGGERVKDFSPARPEPVYTAPEVRASVREELLDMGIDARTGRSIDETEVMRMADEGLVLPEETVALDLSRAAESRVDVWQEAALSIVGCVMEATV